MRRAIVVVAVAVATVSNARAATELTTCSQEIEGDFYLGADLDCSSSPIFGVELANAALDLRSFTFTGRIGCRDGTRCSVTGPGSVIGDIDPTNSGNPLRPGRMTVSDATISGHVDAQYARLTVANSSIGGRARGEWLKLVESDVGGAAGDVRCRIDDSTVTGIADLWGAAVACPFRGVIKNSIIGGGLEGGVFSAEGPMKILGSSITGNAEYGVRSDTRRLLVRDTDISANGLSGIAEGAGSECHLHNPAIRGKVVRTTITGNGTSSACGDTQACADVDWCLEPILSQSTCNTSHLRTSGIPGANLGICALD